jgi:hypothetical protein
LEEEEERRGGDQQSASCMMHDGTFLFLVDLKSGGSEFSETDAEIK